MTLTSLSIQHRAALAMLSRLIEENRVYADAFGYPTGKLCPHCAKEVFASAPVLDQLAAAPGSGLAHDYCHEIAGLKTQLAEAVHLPDGVKLTVMPMQSQDGEDDPANPDQEPEPGTAPEEPPKEDARASA